jgi:hypothetical protein
MGVIMLSGSAITAPLQFNRLPFISQAFSDRCNCSWEAVEATFPAVGWIRNYNLRECLTVCATLPK